MVSALCNKERTTGMIQRWKQRKKRVCPRATTTMLMMMVMVMVVVVMMMKSFCQRESQPFDD
jgi:hypothetical protein